MVARTTPPAARRRKRKPASTEASHAARPPARKRAVKSTPASDFGRMIGLGALILLGTVVVLGAGSLAALLAGYDPPGHEAEARRLRRYARQHRHDFSKVLSADTYQPIGEEIGRGEKWVRNKIRSVAG